MKPPKKPAAPMWGLPWTLCAIGSTLIEDRDGTIIARALPGVSAGNDRPTELQRKRAARIARFIVEAANATIKEPK